MCVPIQRVRRDSAGHITHFGGSTLGGAPWGLTVNEAVSLIESGLWNFLVEVPADNRAYVYVRTSSAGRKYLTTSPDGIRANNLDNLPNIPLPLVGVEPPFPLSIPGPLPIIVTQIRHSGDHRLTPLGTPPYRPVRPPVWLDDAYELNPSASFWTAPVPHWLYLDATVAFPAQYFVSLHWGDSPFQFASLERIPGDDFARRIGLEQAGKGWWTHEFVLTRSDGSIDPSKPSRFTEIKLVIRPSLEAWQARNFWVFLDATSLNSKCRDYPASVSFQFRVPGAPAQPPPPGTVTLPDVAGQRLDRAGNAYHNLGLKKYTYTFQGNVNVPLTDLLAVEQRPPAGTIVKVTDPVDLRGELAVPGVGVKRVAVTNQSNRQTAVNLFVFDYTVGGFVPKGTVAYQEQAVVEGLTDGHIYTVTAVDPTLRNCAAPTDGDCVYQAMAGAFIADRNGIATQWEIY